MPELRQGTVERDPRSLRIAVVTETFLPKIDGVVRSLLELLRYLRRNGHEAIVFAPGRGCAEADGFPVIRAGGVPCPGYAELPITLRCPSLFPILRAWRPDVVHLAGPALLGLQALRAARAQRLPVAAHFQTDLAAYARYYGYPWLAPIIRRYLLFIHNRCARNYVATEIGARQARRDGMRRVHVLGRGVDAELFCPARRSAALRDAWGIRPGELAFLYVGRLAPEKNLDRLAELAVAAPSARLVLVGEGPDGPRLKRTLGDRAVFTGRLDGEALATAYASADVFAFPSLTETFGQVLQEAMASGLPVLAMRAGGVPSVIPPGRAGLLCDPTIPTSWGDNVRLLAAAPGLRRQLGQQGRALAFDRRWERIFDRLIGDYRVLIREGPSLSSRPERAALGDGVLRRDASRAYTGRRAG